MQLHCLHGILTEDGSTTLPSLYTYLEPFGTIMAPDYGYILALESKRINPVVVGALHDYIEDGDIIVGHSNGCAIAYDLIQAGVLPIGLVLINGALRRDIQLPTGLNFCHVYWNDGDAITELAEFGAGASLVDPNWGDMGHAGYAGNDPRVLNVNCGNVAGLPLVHGHSAIFEPLNLAAWGPVIAANIKGALS